MPNKQETFDRVVAHARKQNAKAEIIDDEGDTHCLYRAPNGNMCFAGCLIPDEKYLKNMENGSCISPIVANVLENEGHDPEFAQELQRIHDTELVIMWESNFSFFAKTHSLTYTPPVEQKQSQLTIGE